MIDGLADLIDFENSFGEQIDSLLVKLKVRVLDGEFAAILDPRIREIVSAIAREAKSNLDVILNQLYHGSDTGLKSVSGHSFGRARVCLDRLVRIADGKPSWYGDIPPERQNETMIRPDGILWLPETRGWKDGGTRY